MSGQLEDTWTIGAGQVRERWTIAFPKHSVTEAGTEADGARWVGKVERIRHAQRKHWGGAVVFVDLGGLTINGKSPLFSGASVILRADDVVEVLEGHGASN